MPPLPVPTEWIRRLLPVPILAASAVLLMLPASLAPGRLVPGSPEATGPGAALARHWLAHDRGLGGLLRDRMLGWPYRIDRLVEDGGALDAATSWPFVALLGWPAGFTLWEVAVVAALGVSTAVAARAWWREAGPASAVLAGVAVQASAVVLRAVTGGDTGWLLGAALLPLALAWARRALATGAPGVALAAGLAGAAAALADPVHLLGALAMVVAVAEHTRRGGRWQPRALVPLLLGLGVPLVVPFLHQGRSALRAMGWPLDLARLVPDGQGGTTTVGALLGAGGLGGGGGALDLGPTLWLLAGAGLLVQLRARRARLLAALVAVGLLLAVGPVLPGTAEMPASLAPLLAVPVPALLRQADRLVLVAVLPLALLAAGLVVALGARWGPRRAQALAAVAGLALVAEAALLRGAVHLPATPASAGPRAAAIAAEGGPALVLPLAGGRLQPGAPMLVDQVFHRQVLANGPTAQPRWWSNGSWQRQGRHPVLGQLADCEWRSPSARQKAPATFQAELAAAGVARVFVDRAVLEAAGAEGVRYRACVEGLLGSPQRVVGPYAITAIAVGG